MLQLCSNATLSVSYGVPEKVIAILKLEQWLCLLEHDKHNLSLTSISGIIVQSYIYIYICYSSILFMISFLHSTLPLKHLQILFVLFNTLIQSVNMLCLHEGLQIKSVSCAGLDEKLQTRRNGCNEKPGEPGTVFNNGKAPMVELAMGSGHFAYSDASFEGSATEPAANHTNNAFLQAERDGGTNKISARFIDFLGIGAA